MQEEHLSARSGLCSTGGASDRELLERAARAAKLEGDPLWAGDAGISLWTPQCGTKFWNPLTDDGDALRLAVKLDIEVTPYRDGVSVQFKTKQAMFYTHLHLHGKDKLAAARRGIVRAAAELAMESSDAL